MNAMEKEKREKLMASGFEVGNVSDFLKLTPDEVKLVEAVRAEKRCNLGGYETKNYNRERTQSNGVKRQP